MDTQFCILKDYSKMKSYPLKSTHGLEGLTKHKAMLWNSY